MRNSIHAVRLVYFQLLAGVACSLSAAPGLSENSDAELLAQVRALEAQTARDYAAGILEFRRFIRNADRQGVKGLGYCHLLRGLRDARDNAVNQHDLELAAEITRAGYESISKALEELTEPEAVRLFGAGAYVFLGRSVHGPTLPPGVPEYDTTLGRERAREVGKSLCDALTAAVRKLSSPLYLSGVAECYVRFEFYKEAASLCDEVLALDEGTRRRGPAVLRAARVMASFPQPDWERCMLALRKAVECGDLPSPTVLWAKQEDVDAALKEWASKALYAPATSRVRGYLTLWQHGLGERMKAYWSNRLREEYVQVFPPAVDDGERPKEVRGIKAVDQRTCTADLTFAEGARYASGKWTFHLVWKNPKVRAVLLIDRIEGPPNRRVTTGK